MKLYRPVAAEYPISSQYGVRIDPITHEAGAMHYGIDFATPLGTPVVAAISGKIARAGWEDSKEPGKGFGMRIWQEFDGEYVVYAHLSGMTVHEGDLIVAGTRIGWTGNSGKSSGPHLHLEKRIGGIAGVKGSPIEFVA